jgi:hypothetical protein
MVEKEDEIVGKIWKEVKTMAGNRISWPCFLDTLCCEVEKQESNLT